ncbi:4-alpha-glucanotransferase [Streptomyces sp. SHP 1-2]|uniref:4-alpha-glucanotransferase n=1 Tax=Streptomyces sp. SHP 1-2 TaxID=2769489 RepID=UPI002238664D|nr:4-alpha-glucanotransferase [Streptomyces sp. SHP 1-2]MCW5251713.1 4-alpha-glucanotransferase [Streptomyces sp. SHP 1-2]
MTAARPAGPALRELPGDLTRLAALHGVATSHRASPDRTVTAPAAAVTRALAALGVDAGTPGAVRASLAAARAERAARLLPPTVVARAGQGTAAALTGLPGGTRLRVDTEDGGTLDGTAELPPGVHRLTATAPGGRRAEAHLIVAPDRLPAPAGRSYGLLVQLYSLLSRRSWGMGDLGDLGELAAWAGRSLGAGFVQVNPLHAAVPGPPVDPSPYRPSSRRFPDPVHLRVEDVPEYAYADDPRLRALGERARSLREAVLSGGALIDRDAVGRLKREALELLARVPLGPGRSAALADYRAEGGGALEDHATWCALAEVHGPDWHRWPEPLRDARSAATARARADLRARVDLHARLAWLTDEQLTAAQRTAREAGMPVGIVHDLAVGVHPGGADAWAQREFFAAGMSVGAPPDAFNARGQDWGLPPWRPDRLAAAGYAPYRELLRGLFRYAGALRIDHVMGLFRLWWVPEGHPPTEGAYVRYDAEAMLAVLVLEAARAGAVVIGEDLGTVEPGVREALRERGVLGTSVLWFERDWAGDGRPLPPERWRADCLATATTHDLPPTAARLGGEHVALRDRLGLLTRPAAVERAEAEADTAEWRDALTRLGLLRPPPGRDGATPAAPREQARPDGAGTPHAPHAPGAPHTPGTVPARAPRTPRALHAPVTLAAPPPEAPVPGPDPADSAEEAEIRAVHRFLLRTPARMVGLWLPDAVGDRRPQNLPGTRDQYPNWRLPVADARGRPVTLEDLAGSPRLRALIDAMRSPSGD